MCDDSNYDGYYVVQWTGEPCIFHEDVLLDVFDPPERIKAGELVCAARATLWFTKDETSTIVRMKQVASGDLHLKDGGDEEEDKEYNDLEDDSDDEEDGDSSE